MIRSLLLLATGLVAGGLSLAANVTSTLPVTSSVVARCQLSIANVNFGNIDMTQLSAGVQSPGVTNPLSVLCTSGTNATITISGGNDASSTVTSHSMKSAAGDGISYAIVRPNPAQGESTYLPANGTIAYNSSNGLSPVSIPIQAKFSKADVPSGSYSDVMTVTMTF
jgi:spore coat protein U-like protein